MATTDQNEKAPHEIATAAPKIKAPPLAGILRP
jgi:hypothetical protein